MWNQILNLLCFLTLFYNVDAYINDDKSRYINYQLRGLGRTTQKPNITYRSYPYRYKNLPSTESPYHESHRLRHTRFPKMDGLLSKMSKYDGDNRRYVPKWTTERPYFLRTVKTTTENYDNYDFDEDDKKSDESLDWVSKIDI